jgi:hypothetical protein
MRKRTIVFAIATGLILVAGVTVLLAFLTGSQTACFNPGVSCPATEDIVNGPIAVNASQYNYYQFNIPYGAQDVNVHAHWSSDGSVITRIMNATELISWRNGHAPDSFYTSKESSQGDVSLPLRSNDLYYLVFDNTFSTVHKDVQTSSGFSFMCAIVTCGSGPIRQGNSSSAVCVALNGSEICSLTLSNTGSQEVSPKGTCVESWSSDEGPIFTWGTPRAGVYAPTTQIPTSASVTGSCTVAGMTAPLGLAITVLVPLTNGQNVVMYGPLSLNSPSCTKSETRLVCTFTIENDVTSGVRATECQIQVGDNVSRWKGSVGGTTTFNAENHGGLFTCSVLGSEPAIATPVAGIVRFSDGSYALFFSVWS